MGHRAHHAEVDERLNDPDMSAGLLKVDSSGEDPILDRAVARDGYDLRAADDPERTTRPTRIGTSPEEGERGFTKPVRV